MLFISGSARPPAFSDLQLKNLKPSGPRLQPRCDWRWSSAWIASNA